MQHYLITIDLAPRPTHMHAYVMTDDKRTLEAVTDEMFEFAQKQYGNRPPLLQIVLETKLRGHNVGNVRRVFCRLDPAIAHLIETAIDFHHSVIEVPCDTPLDEALMELH